MIGKTFVLVSIDYPNHYYVATEYLENGGKVLDWTAVNAKNAYNFLTKAEAELAQRHIRLGTKIVPGISYHFNGKATSINMVVYAPTIVRYIERQKTTTLADVGRVLDNVSNTFEFYKYCHTNNLNFKVSDVERDTLHSQKSVSALGFICRIGDPVALAKLLSSLSVKHASLIQRHAFKLASAIESRIIDDKIMLTNELVNRGLTRATAEVITNGVFLVSGH